MDDFNNKLENENQTAENKAAETQTPAAEPQAQQNDSPAQPQQTETPQAQQKSGEEPRTPFQTPVQHPEYQSPRERSNAQQFQSFQQPPIQQTPQQQNGIPYSDAWHQQNQQNAMPHRSKKKRPQTRHRPVQRCRGLPSVRRRRGSHLFRHRQQPDGQLRICLDRQRLHADHADQQQALGQQLELL